MAVRIRLRRIGKNPKKKPHFRVTVFDERTTRDGRFIEELGYSNPISKAVKVDLERYNYWIGKGALPTLAVKTIINKIKKTTLKEA